MIRGRNRCIHCFWAFAIPCLASALWLSTCDNGPIWAEEPAEDAKQSSDDAEAPADDTPQPDADKPGAADDAKPAAEGEEQPAAEGEEGKEDEVKKEAAQALKRALLKKLKNQARNARPRGGILQQAVPLVPGAAMAMQPGQETATDSIFFPADRNTLQRLSKAEELLKDKRYGEGVRLLGSILESPEDYFFQPKREEPIYRSLKGEAQRLIGQMGTEGLASYELQYGPRARQTLDDAVQKGDEAALAEVSRRFFHTQAGYEATYLLGIAELDHGRPLAAALCLKRLQETPAAANRFEPTLSLRLATCWARADMPAPAIATLVALKKRLPNATATIAGQARKLFDTDAQALAWLESVLGKQSPRRQAPGAEQWAMYRGGPSRNAASLGSSPLLNRRWAVPITNDPYVEKTLKELRESYLEQGYNVAPGLHPLAVHDFVFMRSVSGLEAVDFRTGKRIWNGPVDDAVQQLLEPGASGGAGRGPGAGLSPGVSSPVATWLEQRVWDDATYGTLSSDGDNIYCVEDLGTDFAAMNQPQIVLANGRMVGQTTGPRTYNRLAAYEIATEGKLKWDVGSQPGEAQLPLAGAFFLGPPLPLVGRLYVLAEVKGEIRLLALDAKTGELEWSQQLAVLEQTILDDPLRRIAGVSPSYADGVLVCPTSAGAVVAVDLTTRSLMWGYQYPKTTEAAVRNRVFPARINGMPVNDSGDEDRWIDASVTIVDGKVLLTPLESPSLHCLNLLDGKLLWQRPRDEGLYVACAVGGQVMVVGRRSLHAVRLANGENAWSEATVALPAGSSPSGRGFFNGERYYLPLTSAEVAAVDVQSGKIVARSKSRSGTVPGNLICYRGAVISQGLDFVESYYQLEDLRQQVATTLKDHPDDPEALARQGELLLDEGQLKDAVDRLRRSYALQEDRRTRELLVDAMLEGLRLDFAANRDQAAEIERLAEAPAQRATLLRLMATGLQNAGEVVPAFEAYLRMIELDDNSGELERVDNALAVRRDRWVQARLSALREVAGPEDVAGMDRAMAARFEQAKVAEAPDELRKFLAYFGGHPLADDARELLADRLLTGDSPLEAEQLLRRLERSPQAERSRAAGARLARLLYRVGRPEDAQYVYRRLTGEWAELVCLEGKTGAQLATELPAEATERWQTLVHPWPEGVVEREEQKGGPPVNGVRNFAIDFRGTQQPFFAHMTVEMDNQTQALLGRDGAGRERWRVSLRGQNGEMNNFGFNPTLSHVRADGHLLLVSMGFELLAIDTLGTPGKEAARILWRHPLTQTAPGMPRQFGFQGRVINMPWGAQRFMAADANGRPLGNTGPISGDLICFQRMRNLIAVDPLTGETLWTRFDLPQGCEVFGDQDLLLVTPPGATEALVLRTLDGHELGRRQVTAVEQRMATLGRMVLSWTIVNGKAVLSLDDPWERKELWRKEFPTDVKVFPLGEEAIGVLQRNGRFLLLSMQDGNPQVDAQVEAEPNLNEIYVVRSETRDLLITNRPGQVRNIHVQPVPGAPGGVVVNGMVHGFDRATGQKVFSTRVENHGLTLNQPADLPVLTFASNLYEQFQNGRGQSQRGSILCLDKRNGRIVYQEELAGAINNVELVSDPGKHQVTLKTMRSAIRLTFTDKPLPPPPVAEDKPADDKPEGDEANDGKPEAAEPEDKDAQAGLRLLRGLKRLAGIDEPEAPADGDLDDVDIDMDLIEAEADLEIEAGDLEAGDLEAGDLEAGDLEAGDLEIEDAEIEDAEAKGADAEIDAKVDGEESADEGDSPP